MLARNPDQQLPAAIPRACVPSALRGKRATTTEVEFLDRFQRQPNGVRACMRSTKVDGPSGPIMIDQGASFGPGTLFMGLDLAKELDQVAAKHPSREALIAVR
jgi:hypothetical protein